MFKSIPDQPVNAMFAIRRIDFTDSQGHPMYVQVWLYKVMFGWRVYACCTDADDIYPHPRLDWNLCAGKEPSGITLIYNIVCGIIIKDMALIKQGGNLRPFPSFSKRPITFSDEWIMFLEHHSRFIDKDNIISFTDKQLLGWRVSTLDNMLFSGGDEL